MSNRIDELERLGKLRSEGLLTDAEFEGEKAKLFGNTELSRRAQFLYRWRIYVICTGLTALFVAALLIAGWLNEQAGSNAEVRFSKMCIQVTGMPSTPVGLRVSDIIDAAAASGAGVTWEDAGQQQAILHFVKDDKLTGSDTRFDFELTSVPNAVPQSDCAASTTGVVVSRINYNGTVVTGPATLEVLQTAYGNLIQANADRHSQATKQSPSFASSASAQSSSDLEEDPMVQQARRINEACQDSGYGGDANTIEKACKDRDEIYNKLSQRGICYGKQNQITADYYWHRCDANSLR